MGVLNTLFWKHHHDLTNEYISLKELRCIKFVDIIGLISIMNAFMYAGIYFYIDIILFIPLIKVLLVQTPLIFVSVVLNRIGKHQIAKVLLMTNLTLGLFVMCFLFVGKGMGVHDFSLVFTLIPILIWTNKKTKEVVFFIGINAIFFLYFEFFHSVTKFKISIASSIDDVLSGISVFVCFVCAGICIYLFKKLASEKEVLLDEQNKEIEEQSENLKGLNEQLSDKVLELTQSQTELKSTNKIKNKLYSVIAHDLRGPLSSVINLLELIDDKYSDFNQQQIREFINDVHSSSVSIYKLLEDLLDWTRIQDKSIEPKLVNFNLLEIVNNSMQFWLKAQNKKEIKIKVNMDSNLKVFADVDMISMVIRNLVSNAIKFTNRKGIIIVNAKNNSAGYVELIVKDTGIGMTKEEIDKLFKIENNYTKLGTENEKGTGLGLILCKEFIELNKGEIFIESESGIGSSFQITLPSAKN